MISIYSTTHAAIKTLQGAIIRVCLKNAAGVENTVFGFWSSVSFSGNSGVLLPEKDAQNRFQRMFFQPGEHFQTLAYFPRPCNNTKAV